jgi:hypothetical protein
VLRDNDDLPLHVCVDQASWWVRSVRGQEQYHSLAALIERVKRAG